MPGVPQPPSKILVAIDESIIHSNAAAALHWAARNLAGAGDEFHLVTVLPPAPVPLYPMAPIATGGQSLRRTSSTTCARHASAFACACPFAVACACMFHVHVHAHGTRQPSQSSCTYHWCWCMCTVTNCKCSRCVLILAAHRQVQATCDVRVLCMHTAQCSIHSSQSLQMKGRCTRPPAASHATVLTSTPCMCECSGFSGTYMGHAAAPRRAGGRKPPEGCCTDDG